MQEKTLSNNQVLYGRDIQIQTLQDVYKKIEEGGFETVLVSGVSGCGKTALINNALKPLVKKNGLYLYGKCNDYNRKETYAVFKEILTVFVKIILSEPKEVIDFWGDKFRNVLGENISIINDFIKWCTISFILKIVVFLLHSASKILRVCTRNFTT